MILLFGWFRFGGVTVAPVVADSKVGGDDVPRRRYQVKVKNQIHEFLTDEEALAFLNSLPKRQKRKALVLNKTIQKSPVRVYDDLIERMRLDMEEDDEEVLMLL